MEEDNIFSHLRVVLVVGLNQTHISRRKEYIVGVYETWDGRVIIIHLLKACLSIFFLKYIHIWIRTILTQAIRPPPHVWWVGDIIPIGTHQTQKRVIWTFNTIDSLRVTNYHIYPNHVNMMARFNIVLELRFNFGRVMIIYMNETMRVRYDSFAQ